MDGRCLTAFPYKFGDWKVCRLSVWGVVVVGGGLEEWLSIWIGVESFG